MTSVFRLAEKFFFFVFADRGAHGVELCADRRRLSCQVCAALPFLLVLVLVLLMVMMLLLLRMMMMMMMMIASLLTPLLMLLLAVDHAASGGAADAGDYAVSAAAC